MWMTSVEERMKSKKQGLFDSQSDAKSRGGERKYGSPIVDMSKSKSKSSS
jgi:hypothetical protein